MNTFNQRLVAVALALLFCACGDDGVGASEETGGEAAGAGDPDCPGDMGPSMRRMPEGFCIDTTEVTRQQYGEWLETEPDLAGQPPSCASNLEFTPSCAWPVGNQPNHPAACMDWCDARAYCEAAGKRLCGNLEGGAADYAAYASASESEWSAACSSGGQHNYTYGTTHDPSACRGADEDMWAWREVAEQSSCQSPEPSYAGVFDLSGNVLEWENACDGDASASDNCRIRGGSFNYSGDGLRCDMGDNLRFARSAFYVGLGFRCCAD